MLSSATQLKPLHSAIQRMMDVATPSNDRGSVSPTTAANTFAAAAHGDLTGAIGMGAGTSRRTTKLARDGDSGGSLPFYRNGGDRARMRVTAALIGMGAMPWEPGGRYAFL